MDTDKMKNTFPKKETEAILDRLPGDIREMAEMIGLENTLKIVKRWGGGYVVVAKCDELLREIRDNGIRAEYDAGQTTINALALKHNLHIRTINRILSGQGEEVPLPLLKLMEEKTS